MRALVSSGKVDVNAGTGARGTDYPVVLAALRGHGGCLEALLAAPGIDVNKHAGWTALCCAAFAVSE